MNILKLVVFNLVKAKIPNVSYDDFHVAGNHVISASKNDAWTPLEMAERIIETLKGNN